MNKNICFANAYTFWGGGERSYYQYGKLLAERGYKVSYLIKENSVLNEKLLNEDWATLNYINARGSSQYHPVMFFKMFQFFKKNQIDVLFVNTHRDWKATGIPAKLAGVKKIIYTKGTSDSIGMSSSRRFFFDRIITDVLVKSDDSKKLLTASDGRLMDGKFTVLKNGINLDEFNIDATQPIYERQNDEFIFGVSSRLEEVKRVADLIEAVSILKTTHHLNVKLLIAGTGDQEENLQKQVAKLGLEDSITFLGFINDVKVMLKSVDAFAYASEMEGLSNGVMEAMAFSLPIICYKTTSMPELVDDGVNGLLVTPFDIEEFSQKMLKVVKDSDLTKHLGDNSRKRIETEFNITETINNYEKLINSK